MHGRHTIDIKRHLWSQADQCRCVKFPSAAHSFRYKGMNWFGIPMKTQSRRIKSILHYYKDHERELWFTLFDITKIEQMDQMDRKKLFLYQVQTDCVALSCTQNHRVRKMNGDSHGRQLMKLVTSMKIGRMYIRLPFNLETRLI